MCGYWLAQGLYWSLCAVETFDLTTELSSCKSSGVSARDHAELGYGSFIRGPLSCNMEVMPRQGKAPDGG